MQAQAPPVGPGRPQDFRGAHPPPRGQSDGWGNSPYSVNFILSSEYGACAIFGKIVGRGGNAPYSVNLSSEYGACAIIGKYSLKSLNDFSMFYVH